MRDEDRKAIVVVDSALSKDRAEKIKAALKNGREIVVVLVRPECEQEEYGLVENVEAVLVHNRADCIAKAQTRVNEKEVSVLVVYSGGGVRSESDIVGNHGRDLRTLLEDNGRIIVIPWVVNEGHEVNWAATISSRVAVRAVSAELYALAIVCRVALSAGSPNRENEERADNEVWKVLGQHVEVLKAAVKQTPGHSGEEEGKREGVRVMLDRLAEGSCPNIAQIRETCKTLRDWGICC